MTRNFHALQGDAGLANKRDREYLEESKRKSDYAFVAMKTEIEACERRKL